ncbi:efflux RND transporter permease subunit [Wenzhouxiangella sediminis]|uniref:Efflux RND transporter permease subunit n=1 Tax=Wenzhouxiangella sediminis TaxID=1792836 RepID=A0A3E1K8D8_9GAMM|nr:efflux RND transporter permease subunit [Wenzhouxiangella sediminis]RFF30292.1 efflux RND transporter permease subunit [Wenzhouxiangella sediminis]
MNVIRLATRRRVTIAMFTLAVLLFGLVSLSRLDISLLPDLAYPTLTVRTEFAGAAPGEIENLITRPIEEVVGVVQGVQRVRSISRTGQSDVTLEFAWGSDMDRAAIDVRERIERLTLPLQSERPLLLRFDPSTEPVMRFALSRDTSEAAREADAASRILPGDESDQFATLRILRRHAEERLKKDMESIEGVAAITVSGGLEDEIQVLLDQYRLAQLDLDPAEVAQRLRAENVNLSGGRLEEGTRQFLVRTINEFETVEEISGLIVTTRDGEPIYLRDIAEVREGWRERDAITRVDGQEMVELALYREGDANVVSVARAVERRLGRIRSELPADLALTRVYDQSVFIRNAIDEVVQAALIGGLLAIAVLYLFLKSARATVVVGLAIPVSVVATFAAMYGAGLTLNIMSLGGIALAIGLLVDNAIVVLENIAAKREQGMGLIEAARAGAGEVSGAVVAATLTTIAVFLPLAFVDGIAGQLFRDQALTVTFALLVSLAVALTLIPMLASLGERTRNGVGGELPLDDSDVVRPDGRMARMRARLQGLVTSLAVLLARVAGGLFRGIGRLLALLLRPMVGAFNRGYDFLSRAYPRVLEASMRRRGRTVLLAVGLFALAMAMVPRLGMELVPALDQGEFRVEIALSPGTPLEQTGEMVAGLAAVARQWPQVERTDALVGTGDRMDANPEEAGEHRATFNVVLKPGADGEAVQAALRDYLDERAGVDYTIGQPELFTLATPLEVEVAGYDLEDLRTVAARIAAGMNESSRFDDVRSSAEQGYPEIRIRFDHERAARLGLRADQIADTVVRQVRGDVPTRYSWREREIDVRVRVIDEQRASPERIGQLVVNPGAERPVTLDAVADIDVAVGPGEIRRVGQQRVAVVSADASFGDLGSAAAEAREIIAAIPMPRGVSVRVAGQSDEMQRAFGSLVLALGLAVFLVYLVMASQFESLLHPFVILLTIPLALTGAVFALWLTGTTLSVVVFIGVIMLAGIVVNNAIVLVTRINQLRAEGMPRETAIVEAGRARLRPIVMTTLTTVLGLLPLAIGLGEGSEMRAPMAIAVIGGLLLSTALTLVVIPVVYSLLDRRRTAADDGTAREAVTAS